MKGLALILGKAARDGMLEDDDEDASPISESPSSSAKEYARLVIEALKDDDTDGAAEALLSLVRCRHK